MSIKSKVLEALEKSIAEIQSTLAVQVLDGTPYLLLIEHEGLQMIYGGWDGVVGFKVADLVPDHLCGSIQMDQPSACKTAAKINAQGPDKASYMHWRAFLEKRLESQIKMKAMLETPTETAVMEAIV